ncbi:phosphoenolpyruvate--protein phosphotransferase [Williamsia sterculiae]|uniref:Phosphoenolpyruvate-protein phosphotransferase n=1 Tax=Williamsia sterculiae TaxID=1344003 RepID=A0A1N7EE83_9NOCA|nr:phosphoenolpyruvate--protein phosphotransferase [Williamsia sterculiae]
MSSHVDAPVTTDPDTTDTVPARTVFTGTPVVAGVAYAPVIRPGKRPDVPDAASSAVVDDAERVAEGERFTASAARVADRLRARASAATGVAAEVLSATAGLAQDRGWTGTVGKLIVAGSTAETAVATASAQFVDMFTTLGGVMAERVTDLRDVRDRVIADLSGVPEPGVPQPDRPSVLCADDLAPADTAGLDPAMVRGLVTRLGGPTSHTAIIARQLGIPCVVAVDGLDRVPVGTRILVDGGAGEITVEPDPDQARDLERQHARHAAEIARWNGPGTTADGVPVAILANVQDGISARKASTAPVEGIGLFRTELAFLDRATEPTVDEQTAIYREVLEAFPGGKVVIRTLDAGSDKPLQFADQGVEANPALGVRGLRIATGSPGLLTHQLDAIAAAAAATGESPWVMAPMVATAAEARDFAALCRDRGLTPGVMVEVPAAALLAPAILAEVDFVSIGTNDLTQYTMAADRMSSELAALTDPWQPAVLRLIEMVGRAGGDANKPVGVCGEAAADPVLACVLVGLGVTSLSGAPTSSATVGARLADADLAHCRAAAAAALATADPIAAREAAAAALSG